MLYRDLQRHINDALQTIPNSSNDINRLQKIYDAMCQYVEKHCAHPCKKENTKLRQFCDSILHVIHLMKSGRRFEAHSLLYDLYFSEKGRKYLCTCTIDRATAFYRMRKADTYTQYTSKKSEEMYHIPFELRYKVGNERYSISGLPTLYLSSSVYGCWEETKRPNLDFSNVALFKSTKPLLFLDMTLPTPTKTLNQSMLMGLPLIYASRLEVQHNGENFIPEYIIPQLAMECLIQTRNEEINEDTLIGIKYESIYQNRRDLLFKENDRDHLFINYAIPPFSSIDTGVCPLIKELFELRGNTSWAEIKYKNAMSLNYGECKTYYDLSVFGIIEKKLNLLSHGMLTYRTRKIGGISIGCLA